MLLLEIGKFKKNLFEVFEFNFGCKLFKVMVVEFLLLKVIVVNNEMFFRFVKVVDRKSFFVFDMSVKIFSGMGRVFICLNYGLGYFSNSLWLMEEDKRCKYFDNFRLFF